MSGIRDILYACFRVEDLDKQQQFLEDFSFNVRRDGDQLFHGFLLEHVTDGDLLNESFGAHLRPIDKLLGVHWGPDGGPK